MEPQTPPSPEAPKPVTNHLIRSLYAVIGLDATNETGVVAGTSAHHGFARVLTFSSGGPCSDGTEQFERVKQAAISEASRLCAELGMPMHLVRFDRAEIIQPITPDPSIQRKSSYSLLRLPDRHRIALGDLDELQSLQATLIPPDGFTYAIEDPKGIIVPPPASGVLPPTSYYPSLPHHALPNEAPCPVCNEPLSHSAGVTTTDAPVHGDYSICAGCGSLLSYVIEADKPISHRSVPIAELTALKSSHPAIYDILIKAMKATRSLHH